MNQDRRLFINRLSLLAAFTAFSKPLSPMAAVAKRLNTLHASGHQVTIYHTNDLHGNLQPVFAGTGGLNHIQTLLKNQETGGLLLDAGGFLDLSKSISGQKMMIGAMNNMGYHAATVGSRELALGEDHLAGLLSSAQFSVVNCNYRFNGELNNLIKPYTIVYSGKFKIGITGVGHKVSGVAYNDAVKSANAVAKLLKEKEQCDLVICLSHLGYKHTDDQPDDRALANQSEHIDMIVSGHSTQFSMGPSVLRNRLKHEVLVSRTGFKGLMLGKTVFAFEGGKQKRILRAKNIITGQDTRESFSTTFTALRAKEKALAAS